MSLRKNISVDPLTATLRIDSHHHLWEYNEIEFSWIDEPMSQLRRNFFTADLGRAMDTAHVQFAVAVQARRTVQETEWLLAQARSEDRICGVVGWVPLLADDLSMHLDTFRDQKKLVAFREIVQAEPDGFLDRPDFDLGIRQLTQRGLAYDLLLRENQLAEAVRFVDRHPNQQFVLDHAAKPLIARGVLEPWRTHIHELGRRPNVACKISGLVTEAGWDRWTLDEFRPYLDTCVKAFGSGRLLAGSDWPVCLVASSYARWWQALEQYFAPFSAEERSNIFARNAIKSYKLLISSLSAD